MKSHFGLALGLLLLSNWGRGVSAFIHMRPPNGFPLVHTQEGHGYNAKVSVYPDAQGRMSNGFGHHEPQLPRQHATFDSVVNKITQGLMHRKSLPRELEKQHEAEDAQNLELLHEERNADGERHKKAHRIQRFLHIRKLLEQRRKRNGMGRRKYGNGMRKLGKGSLKHNNGGHHASIMAEDVSHNGLVGYGHQGKLSPVHHISQIQQGAHQNYAPQQTYQHQAYQQQAYQQPVYAQQVYQQTSDNQPAKTQQTVKKTYDVPDHVRQQDHKNTMKKTYNSMTRKNYVHIGKVVDDGKTRRRNYNRIEKVVDPGRTMRRQNYIYKKKVVDTGKTMRRKGNKSYPY